MASPLPAAKVKAFLTAVKSELESLLNTAPLQQQHDRREISPTTGAPPPAAAAAAQATDANTPNAPPLRFEQLLQLQVWVLNLELLQRGNVKVLASTSGAASDVNVTLGLVRETSGKEVMSPSGGDPVRNLQSNVSILQGRVAEAIVTADPQQQSKLSSSSSSSSDVVDAALLSQVQARCREVQDDRFLSLLLLLSSALAANASPPPPGAPPSSSTSAFDDTQVLAWSYVAEGCYGRAGILAQTNPPPFKAAWDVVVQRNTRRCKDHDGEPEHPWEALDWIGHLRRIAAGRNNHKKVSELSLTVLELCLPIPSLEDFLSDDPESTKQPPAPLFKARAQSTTSASPSSSLLATVQKAFVTPVRSMDPPTPQAVLDMCEEQLRYLKKHHQSDNPDDDTGGDASFRLAVQTCMYHLLWTLQNHDRAVEADGQARHVAAMNRRASAADKVSSKSSSVQSSSSSSAVLTLEECLRQARTDFFQLMADDEEYVQTFFEKGGVDALLEAMQRASSVPRSTHKVPAEGATGQGAEPTAEAAGEMAHRVVASFLSSWHRDYLQARMLQRHRRQTKLNGDEVLSVALMEWTQRTISNLLRGWHGPNEASPKSADTPPIWVVMLATMVPELEWMLQHVLSISDAHLFPIDVHRAAQNVLQSVFDSAVPSPSLTSESLVVRDTNSSSRLSLLQWANRSLQATLYLSQQADEGASLVNLPALLSEPMAGSSQPHSAARSGRFGTDFYELAVVWNGLHTTVHWPYCVTPEARIVVERARTSLEWAEKHWGRPTSDVEGWILKIALADAEGGARIAGSSFSSTGGLVGLAKALYEHVLNEIDSANEAGKVGFPLRALLKSKCFSGLVNVSLHSSLGADRVLEFLPEDDLRTPEGLSRRNLDLILQVLKASDTMSWAPLRIFGSSPQSVERAFRLQVAYVRNQVADCLIRKSLVEEAGVFLQEAVVASPDDPGATLALGAFRLRLMFLDSADPHRNAAKAAQIQLLKAAKLDASKSSPFALLGYWYEYMKDEKRALGCYSKALLLDPWHPVAGRGITRLQPRETVLQLLQKATDSGSPFSGWAWKALGVHKAMVEGSDDLAVVCLLQALRCADVASPTGSDLSVFFASPFQSKEAGDYELVDTLAELAECYRRLGRFTASLRSYNKALDIAAFQGPPRPSLLLSCAQGTYMCRPIRNTWSIHTTHTFSSLLSRNGAWTVRRSGRQAFPGNGFE